MNGAGKTAYNKLALVYSHLMRNIRYDIWAKYLYNISKKYVGKKAKVLELGAGTGLLTRPFSKYYPDIFPSDISLMMIKNLRTIKRLTVCDMTSLPYKGQFDIVLCAFDSVNYLLTETLLFRLFTEVENVLAPEGIFLFDVSLENNSYKHSSIPYSRGSYRGVSYINRSEYDPEKRTHTNYFEIMEDHQTYKEIHKQKIFQFETYFKILERTSLYPSECYDAFTFSKGGADCDRVQFVVKKIKR